MGFLSPMIVAGFVDSNVSILYKSRGVHNFILWLNLLSKPSCKRFLILANNWSMEKCVFAWKCNVLSVCHRMDDIWFFWSSMVGYLLAIRSQDGISKTWRRWYNKRNKNLGRGMPILLIHIAFVLGLVRFTTKQKKIYDKITYNFKRVPWYFYI